MDYDALVVGSGISGMESALKLADMGHRVHPVRRCGCRDRHPSLSPLRIQGRGGVE